jgi:putative transposase
VKVLCRTLSVSCSGYYKWREAKDAESQKQKEDALLKTEIKQIHKASDGTYGRPRIHLALLKMGRICGKHRLGRLMREEALSGCRRGRFRVMTTNSRHSHPVAPNLLKERGKPTALRQIWAADITYIRTRNSWAYLAAVLDMYSRKIVGWSMSQKIDTDLVSAALRNALQNHGTPDMHHSDRGSQYASEAYRTLLSKHNIEASMSRKGNCYDNATMESFFGTLKAEAVGEQVYPSFDAARQHIFSYIEAFYNTRRIHTSIGGLSPQEFEDQYFETTQQAGTNMCATG